MKDEKKKHSIHLNVIFVWVIIFTIWLGYKYHKRFRVVDERIETLIPLKVDAEVSKYSSQLSHIQRELKSLERDWKIEKGILDADKEFIMSGIQLFMKHVEQGHGESNELNDDHDDEAMIKMLEGKSFPEVLSSDASDAKNSREVDWGFLEIDTSEHDLGVENALREQMSPEQWEAVEAKRIDEARWNEYFENAAPEAEKELFRESVERRFSAWMETYEAIEKANRIDEIADESADDFVNDPEIKAAFAASKKQMLKIIRADVAGQIRRQNGLSEEDGQVIVDPEKASGDVRLRTDYLVEMQRRETRKYLEKALPNELSE